MQCIIFELIKQMKIKAFSTGNYCDVYCDLIANQRVGPVHLQFICDVITNDLVWCNILEREVTELQYLLVRHHICQCIFSVANINADVSWKY